MSPERLFLNLDSMIQMQGEKKDQPTPSKPAQHTMANGLEDLEMDTAFRNGPMALSTRDNGKTIELTVKVNSFISTEIFTMVSGLTIRQMATESITTLMVQCMKDTGEMTCNMEREKKAGQTVPSTKETTWLERSTASVSTAGTTEANILVTGKRIK